MLWQYCATFLHGVSAGHRLGPACGRQVTSSLAVMVPTFMDSFHMCFHLLLLLLFVYQLDSVGLCVCNSYLK